MTVPVLPLYAALPHQFLVIGLCYQRAALDAPGCTAAEESSSWDAAPSQKVTAG